MEIETDFVDNRLPTLDFKLWVNEEGIVVYTFYEKPMSSNQVMHQDSALPENMRVASLNAEVVRRMQNCSELLPVTERVVVLDRYAQKMSNSGYNLAYIRKRLIGGLKGYEGRLWKSKLDKTDKRWRALHESAGASWGTRWKKKLLGKSTWYKGGDKNGEASGDDKNHGSGDNRVNIRQKNRSRRKWEKLEWKTKEDTMKNKETTSVMFLEYTAHGELVRRLQTCEDRNSEVTNRRVKMVEQGGTQLRHLLPNTDPWSGSRCPRDDCPTCTQGGKETRKDNCFRRNILYEARCGLCVDKREQELKEEHGRKTKKKRKFGELFEEENVYVGETSRSIYERSKEHLKAGRERQENSFIAKHWQDCHPELQEPPEFRFKIVRFYKDPLSRQVGESVRIDMRVGVLNSKTMFSRNTLPRLVLEMSEKEKETGRNRK